MRLQRRHSSNFPANSDGKIAISALAVRAAGLVRAP